MRNRMLCGLVAIVAGGCMGSAEPLASDTGVIVEVALWPIDPVEVEGQPSRTRSAVGARVVAFDTGGDEVTSRLTDDQGVARLLLAPGSYTIRVVECPGAMSLPKENADVTVSAGAFESARLACDTGIR